MTGRERLLLLVSLVLLVGLVWTLWLAPAVPTPPGPPPGPKVAGPQGLNLTYNDQADVTCKEDQADCVDVLDTDVWKKWNDNRNKDKPKRVRWWVDNSQKKMYHWEFEFKSPTTTDYLGPVDAISCKGKQWTDTSKIVAGSPGKLDWYYRVTVWSCDGDGNKLDCLCQSDPRVGIRP